MDVNCRPRSNYMPWVKVHSTAVQGAIPFTQRPNKKRIVPAETIVQEQKEGELQ